jgi:hypothetical protein
MKIKKGKHYPFLYFLWIRPIWVRNNKTTIRESNFMFTDSCIFDLKDEDQHDVNKLFGFSIGHHQKGSSFRFGWRPILDKNKIEIVAYEYHDGVRQKTTPMGLVNLNQWYHCNIAYLPMINRSYFCFGDLEFEHHVELKKKTGLGYTLGVYFGGNEKAPQDITIFKRLKR